MSDPTPTPGTDRPYIGGQAVLEGVMMRSPHSFAVAVRRADGSISIRERPIVKKTSAVSKIPFLRGMATLVESLRLGSEALRFSADQMEKDMEAEEATAKKLEAGAAKKAASKVSSALSAFGLALAQLVTRANPQPGPDEELVVEEKRSGSPMVLMTIIMVVFMFALPQLLAFGASSVLKLQLEVQSPKFQLLTGFFKLFIVIGYLLLIRRVAEIRRVFQYHGAEHKTISTYEAKEELVVANARKKTTMHPRCGTTFLVMTVIVSIIVWTALGPLMPKFEGSAVLKQLIFFGIKLPFILPLVGLTFEIQRFTARYCLTGPMRALLYPGFLVQKITTIEPDDDQLEIALASLRATLWREEIGTDKRLPKGESEVIQFPSYEAMVESPGLREEAA